MGVEVENMTVIVGWWSETGGGMAADQAMEKDGKQRPVHRPKVRAIPRVGGGNILFGFTGCSYHDRYWNEVKEVPGNADADDLAGWLELQLDGFGSWLRDRGDGAAENGVWSIQWAGLVLAREGLFELWSHGEAMRVAARDGATYAAVGSGGEVALGALYVSSRIGFAYQDRLRLSVEAANAEAAGCGIGVDMLCETWE